ncbi:MAG: STAS domain-containing protein [Candidatus Aminicenantes bacterium]|nr:STAS domain-containing protein [Candidatus Aminicenantes bacterium]
MKINKRKNGEIVILDLDGKLLTGNDVGYFREIFDTLIKGGETKIILNLKKLRMMDSTGLGELTRSYTTAKNNGGMIKLVDLTAKIKDLLFITKIITIFETYDSEDEAVKSF